jgi:hypothetical protein
MTHHYKTLVSTLLCTLGICTAHAENYAHLTNLPTLYIDTEDSVAITSKEEYVNATLRYVDNAGITLYDALKIRGRGNSTWGMEKKPYRLKFDKKQRLLGKTRANAKSWTLLANHADKTLIRNAVAAYIGDLAGQPFTAAAQFADLVVNGDYCGCYQISDQIEIRDKRVNITEQTDAITPESDISGGYLLEVDGFALSEPAHFSTKRGVLITIKSPDDEIIDTLQVSYIQAHINKFEDALFSTDFTDSINGYRRYVDAETLASWYISSELTGNPDCFWSTYIYKERGDDKIYWGPLWDYDIAFNNCNTKGDVSRKLMVDIAYGRDLANGELTKLWVNKMWEDPWFRQIVHDKWKSMIANNLKERLCHYIDSVSSEIDQSQQLNSTLWPINQRTYVEITLFDTYAEGIDYLKEYLQRRCAYLTEVFEQAAQPILAFEPKDCSYRIQNYQNKHYADVNNNRLVTHSMGENKETQLWNFIPSGDGYFYIINAETNRAITDLSDRNGSQYSRGAGIGLSALTPKTTQEWYPRPISRGRYILTNRATGLVWNNCAGSSEESNPAISWTDDPNDSYEFNNQWQIIACDSLSSVGIEKVCQRVEYKVTYSPEDAMLHFRAESDAIFDGGTLTIYTPKGAILGILPIAREVSLSTLPEGIYLLRWQTGEISGSCKVIR